MNWLQRLLRTDRMERELDAELRFHFESQVADKMKSGMSEAEARRAARLEFGGLEQIKQDCRESRGTVWVAAIVQDLRFGARILAKSPGFSAVAILVLALGIGVSTLSFSLYNLIALQSIPVHDPATIVRIERRSLKAGFRKNLSQVEEVATIVSLLGGVAIFLAVVGLLGLVSYAVSRRTREIAIRLAVGAKRTEICIAVLNKFVWPVCTGLVAGVALTSALSQIIRRGLYGISGCDPISYAAAAASLVAILFLAALLPMRRAFRLDIASILHSE